jgi:hypothetical protein
MLYSYNAKPDWEGLIQSLGCTHFITCSPLVPALKVDEALKIGETLAKRLKDRADLPAGKIVLIPEQCSEGKWHYHGFVAVTTPEQAEYLMTEAPQMLEEAMKQQAVRKYRPDRYINSEPRSSARIEPLGEEPDGALHYATKYWERQDKAANVIYV